MKKNLAVLMSTYNGEKYLKEQLESIENQTYKDIDVYIRDDGSTDNTIEIIKEFEEKYGNIHLILGENVGPCKSFFNLIFCVPDNYDYYAFADQDDFWLQDKLERAIKKMNIKDNIEIPCLFFTDTILVDKNLNRINQIRKIKKENVCEENAIIENLATGCTVVINQKLKCLLKRIKAEDLRIGTMHDDFAYKLCSLSGKVIFDEESRIYYRQHENNVIGSANSITVLLKKRYKSIKKNIFLRKHYANVFLNKYKDIIKKEYFDMLDGYSKYNFKRIKMIFNFKIKRIKFIDDILYRISLLFNIF